MGVNIIEMTFYPDIYQRAIDKFWKLAAQKFDYKWFSGDWKDDLPATIHGDANFNVDQCIQPLPEAVTRDVELSTENFNITLRTSDFRVRIPAPLSHNGIKCSDVILKASEFTFIAASALPREFLPDEIFALKEEEKIVFPDDSSKNIRFQINMNGFTMEVISSPLYGSTRDPQKVLYLRALTFLGSYDRAEGVKSEEEFHLFLSLLLHHVQCNIDFDVLFGAVATLKQTFALGGSNSSDSIETSQVDNKGMLSKLPKEVKLNLRLSLSKIDCRVWRQNVPVTMSQIAVVPRMPLTYVDIENLEFGSKGTFLLSKLGSLAFEFSFIALQIAKVRLAAFETVEKKSYESEINENGLLTSPEFKEITVMSIGESESPTKNNESVKFSIHMSDSDSSKLSCNIVVALENGKFFVGDRVENAFLLVMEAALDPEWLSLLQANNDGECSEIDADDTRKTLDTLSKNTSITSRIELRDIILATPIDGEEEHLLLLVCEKTDVHIELFLNLHETSKKWLQKLFSDETRGFHGKVISRQKVVRSTLDQFQSVGSTNALSIVDSFEVCSYLQPLHAQAKIQSINMTTKDIVGLNKLSESFFKYKERLDSFVNKASKLMSSLHRESHFKIIAEETPNRPVTIACKSTKESMEKAYLLVEEMNNTISALKEKIDDSFTASKTELNKSRELLFKKESERYAAFALLTNAVSGYLQVGSTAVSNQRIVSVTNFWRHWVVLKQSTIILYNNPSDVSDFIRINPFLKTATYPFTSLMVGCAN